MKNWLRQFRLACGVVALLAVVAEASTPPTFSLNMAGIKKAAQGEVIFRDIACDPNADDCEILAGPGSRCVDPQAHPTWVDLNGLGGGNPAQYVLNVSDLGQILRAFAGDAWTADPGNMNPGECPYERAHDYPGGAGANVPSIATGERPVRSAHEPRNEAPVIGP